MNIILQVATLMRRCWAQEAADRPDFPALKQTIRKINKWVISLCKYAINVIL